jgi:hypothetical protein
MSALSTAGDGIGAVLVALAIPVSILAIGIPFAYVISLILGLLGLS